MPRPSPSVIGVVEVADRQVGDRPSADDAVLGLPEAVSRLEEDLGRGVVVELADGTLFARSKGVQHLDVAQDREWGGDDGVVRRGLEAAGRGLVVDDRRVGGLVHGDHPGPETRCTAAAPAGTLAGMFSMPPTISTMLV